MTLHIRKGRNGWYWRLKARNGRVVAIGGEPFASKSNARRSFEAVAFAFGNWLTVDVTEVSK